MAYSTVSDFEDAPIVARQGDGGEPAPDGLHAAVCVDVIDRGLVDGAYGARHQARVVWQLAEEDGEGRRFLVSRVYTLSLAPRAALRRDLESWRGKAFTAEELTGFDLRKLLGVNCQVHTISALRDGGRRYANVQAVLPAVKGGSKLAARDYVRQAARPSVRGNSPAQGVARG